ncbi:hypothetical protein QZH41_015751, partial [Actinostola sp. cb2023]
MAGFENQPPASRSRTSTNIDDTLSDVSTAAKDTSDFRRRGNHSKEAYETYKRLQSDYDELLTKYAQAENTIDQLKIGAKLNLYSDLPPPQKGSFVSVPGGKQPHVFNFPRPIQANFSGPSTSNVVTDHSNGTNDRLSISRNPEPELDLLTPEVRAEGIRTSLMFKIPTLQENVEDLQGHVTDGQWGLSELRELQDVCNQLTHQHGEMKRELLQAKQLERNSMSSEGNFSLDEDFVHEDGLEGQLYRLGLRLDEINEHIDQNLHQFLDNSDECITNRSANSLADVEDLESNPASGLQNREKEDDFTLGKQRWIKDCNLPTSLVYVYIIESLSYEWKSYGPLNDDSDGDNDKKRDSQNGGIDLQESGYYASETMSVSIGNDNSDPISNHYLSNSNGLQHPMGERGASFEQQSVTSSPRRERPLSDTSAESSPNARRSRRTSQRSRSSTVETPAANPMSYYPENPATSPVERSSPQASSSILTDQTRHQPHADRRDSRLSNSSAVRPRAGTSDSRHSIDFSPETRNTKPRSSGNQADILRTEHDTPDHVYRNRTTSLGDDISPRSHSVLPESLESSPRQDDRYIVMNPVVILTSLMMPLWLKPGILPITYSGFLEMTSVSTRNASSTASSRFNFGNFISTFRPYVTPGSPPYLEAGLGRHWFLYLGPRSDHDTRPMDKQSMRSYPGMDRESVRSGRRSRRDDDSTSGYSDNGRKHKRDRVDKLQEELQRLRTQLQDEASARNLQTEMYGDLRRKHDDLEREISRRAAENQMKTMYEDLQKKYEDLSKGVENQRSRDSATQVDLSDDLKRRLEDLTLQVNDLRYRGDASPGFVRFLCPFCGGCNGHHHGSYYYPGTGGTPPANEPPGTSRIHSMGTQTHFVDDRIPQSTRYPSTPQATSTPYFTGYAGAPAHHYHTNTYPGGVPTASPVHHVHHMPDSRSRDHCDDDYSSDEDDRHRSRRRGSSYRGSRRRGREMYQEDE